MRIAVTGSNGFIGRCVVQAARAAGHEVLCITRSEAPGDDGHVCCDLRDGDGLAEALEGCDAVVHLAAVMSGRNQLQDTLAATRGLLTAMSACGIRRLVAVSSIAVLDYPSFPPGSLIDEHAHALSDEATMGSYALMKSRQEALVESWSKGEGRILGLVRPGLVYDEHRLSSAHAGSFGFAALHAGQVPVVHVDSVAEALVSACTLRSSSIIHLVDDALPSQSEYLRELRARGGPVRIPLPWRLYAVLMGALRLLLPPSIAIPDGLRRHSIAARQKPFLFSNAHAKAQLRWLPRSGSCAERGAST